MFNNNPEFAIRSRGPVYNFMFNMAIDYESTRTTLLTNLRAYICSIYNNPDTNLEIFYYIVQQEDRLTTLIGRNVPA